MTRPDPRLVKAVANIEKHGAISGQTGEKDNVLVLMNKREAGALPHLLGQAPSFNQASGVMAFEPGGRSSDGHSAGGGPSGGGSSGGGSHGSTGSTAGGMSSPEGGGGSVTGHNAANDHSSSDSSHNSAVGNERAAEGVHAEGGTVTGSLGAGGVTRSSADAEHNVRSSLGLGPTDATPRTFESPFTRAVATMQSPLTKVLNFVSPLGIEVQAPKLGLPSTYSMGQPNLGINPAHALGSLAGLAMGGVPGAVMGPMAGAAYSHLGGQDVSLGGVGPTSEGSGLNGTGVRSGTADSGGMSSPGSQAAGHVGNGSGGGQHDLAAALSGVQAPSVGTGATGGQGLPALYAPPAPGLFQGQSTPLNTYTGTPWPVYPNNVWMGGGSGSRSS